MTKKFDETIQQLLEKYDSDSMDDEKMARARAYYAIGHQGMDDEDFDDEEERPLDFCWLWINGLKVGTGYTHNMTFGSDVVDKARFKGWYDSTKDILSFIDDKGQVTSQDEIPAQIYSHLIRKFNPGTIRVF